MKIKHLITAAAVFCSLSVCAFASEEGSAVSDSETQTDPADAADIAVAADVASVYDISVQTDETGTQSVVVVSDGKASNVDTGVGGVAAFAGIITLTGAVVVISRKKS